MQEIEANVLDRCGLAALSDLRSPQVKDLISLLEQEQNLFLAQDHHFRSPEYKWPRDALHWWSRIWEYPYAYSHLRQWRQQVGSSGPNLIAVDVGSGVTFFPFAVSKLGYDLMCLDIDSVCQRDLSAAVEHVEHRPGNVKSLLIDDNKFPLSTGQADIVYCVSVLEHVPKFEQTIGEMARVLKPGGRLVLTIDLAIEGSGDIGVERYAELMSALTAHFTPAYPNSTVHPANALYSSRGPHPYNPPPTGLALARSIIKREIKAKVAGKQTPPALLLAVEGLVMTRRG